MRNAEIKYFGDQLKLNSNDIFKTWKVLKTILALNNTSHKKKLCVTIDNHPVSNRKDIANGFNDFFVSIVPKLAKDIHSNINPFTYVHNINDSIAVFDVSCVEVANVIHSLKNSSA